jgi:dipeptidyl aminopeptidase/acylaminoacyl peptidase
VYSRHYANRRAANQILVGLHLVKADGSEDRRLLAEFDREVQIQEHPSWSPDGKRLALSGGGNDTGNSSKDTFVCDIDTEFKATGLRKLVPSQGVSIGEEPCWSPDGKRLVAVNTVEQLFVVDADGKNRAQILQVDGSYCHQPEWSPDGDWIAFATDRDGNVEIYKVRPDGTELTRLTRAPGLDAHPRWSPDGRWLSFTSNRDGNYDIWVMRADGSDAHNLTRHSASDDHATWSPDGKSIAFVSMRDGGFDIYRLAVPTELAVTDKPPPRETPAVAAPNDLVLHYSFDDEPAGAPTVRDRAGRHSLQLVGARLVTSAGRKTGALAFDGKMSSASAGNATDLRLSGPLTISLWVRPESISGNGYLVSKHGWNIYLGTDAIPRFETRTADDKAWDTLAAKQPLPSKAWSFVAVVFDPQAKHKRIYLDGKLSAESARNDGAIGAVAGYPLDFGHYVATKSQPFVGQIDEVRLEQRALSADQIRQEFARQRKLVLTE